MQNDNLLQLSDFNNSIGLISNPRFCMHHCIIEIEEVLFQYVKWVYKLKKGCERQSCSSISPDTEIQL